MKKTLKCSDTSENLLSELPFALASPTTWKTLCMFLMFYNYLNQQHFPPLLRSLDDKSSGHLMANKWSVFTVVILYYIYFHANPQHDVQFLCVGVGARGTESEATSYFHSLYFTPPTLLELHNKIGCVFTIWDLLIDIFNCNFHFAVVRSPQPRVN